MADTFFFYRYIDVFSSLIFWSWSACGPAESLLLSALSPILQRSERMQSRKGGRGSHGGIIPPAFSLFFFFFNPLEFHVVAGSVLFMRSDSFFLLYTCVEVDLVDFTTVLKENPGISFWLLQLRLLNGSWLGPPGLCSRF